MDANLKSHLITRFEEYQTSISGSNKSSEFITYGTAGFRGHASSMEQIFHGVGLISGLLCLKEGANIGVMITASHNPVDDNGVKIINPKGEMLSEEWEKVVEKFCNIKSSSELSAELDRLTTHYDINTLQSSKGKVFLGYDTRPSSLKLLNLVKAGLGGYSNLLEWTDYGLVTTPVLHYLVGQSNRKAFESGDTTSASMASYCSQLISGLETIYSKHKNHNLYNPSKLVIDCANGVGMVTMEEFLKDNRFTSNLKVDLINTGDGILNKDCGADYVKTQKLPPLNAKDTTKRYASLDGDADRVVYFFLQNIGDSYLKLNLLDGDKIMALYALYFKDAIHRHGIEKELTLGVIQTAYANGASTKYMTEELGLEVQFADTGVKNLHKKAIDYDFGIYFEANGHGTILISSNAKRLVRDKKIVEFIELFEIINNYTGDAISDVLVAESILRYYDWDIHRWYKLYQDRPNSLIKVEVNDRNSIKTTDAGRICLQPAGLQAKIDDIVSSFGSEARSFVRPSGTENVVRVYAEASDQESADKLAELVGHETKRALQFTNLVEDL